MARKENRFWGVADCETDSFDGAPVCPFIWGIKTQFEENIFYSTIEFIEWVKEFRGILLFHNGGKFDILFLVEYFELGSIKIINSRVAEVKIGECTLRDSFLIIPSSLASAGHKDDFDYSILDRKKKHLRKKYAAQIEKYLMQDCRGLYELVERFYSRFGQRLTQAGAALAEWEKMGGLVRRWGGAHDAHFRQFYFGGRCEAFQKGVLGNDWNYFDIKSSYPNVMQYDHPACRLDDYFLHNKIKNITPQSFARIVAANHGCLPQRGKYSTEYPHHDDPREYYSTGWEIIAGLETNTLKIFEATIWRPCSLESLKPYTDRFYAEKLDAEKRGDKIDRTIAKIFQNSLYGKYGSNADEYKKYEIVEAGFEKPNYSTYAEIGERDIIQTPSAGQHYDVALAASITGAARAFLFRQIMTTKNIAYCDTDSIVCKDSPKNFDIGEKIGQWEHVHTLNNFHVAGKKLYAGQDKKSGEWITAHKGFSSLDTSYADVIAAATGQELKILRKAPNIKITGQQKFIERTMRKT